MEQREDQDDLPYAAICMDDENKGTSRTDTHRIYIIATFNAAK